MSEHGPGIPNLTKPPVARIEDNLADIPSLTGVREEQIREAIEYGKKAGLSESEISIALRSIRSRMDLKNKMERGGKLAYSCTIKGSEVSFGTISGGRERRDIAIYVDGQQVMKEEQIARLLEKYYELFQTLSFIAGAHDQHNAQVTREPGYIDSKIDRLLA